MDREEVLAAYLNKWNSNLIEKDNIIFDYDHCYSYGGNQYTILLEGDEEYEYLKEYSDELIELDKYDLEKAGFNYIIPYIDFEKMYEDDGLLDHGFEEFTYKGDTYFINEE